MKLYKSEMKVGIKNRKEFNLELDILILKHDSSFFYYLSILLPIYIFYILLYYIISYVCALMRIK